MKKQEIAFAAIVAVGLACIVYGVALIWYPGLWIAGGLSILALAALLFLDVA